MQEILEVRLKDNQLPANEWLGSIVNDQTIGSIESFGKVNAGKVVRMIHDHQSQSYQPKQMQSHLQSSGKPSMYSTPSQASQIFPLICDEWRGGKQETAV